MANNAGAFGRLWRFTGLLIALVVLLFFAGIPVAMLAKSLIQDATWKRSSATVISATLTRPAAPLPRAPEKPPSSSRSGVAKLADMAIELGEEENRAAKYRYTVQLVDHGGQQVDISLVGVEHKIGDQLQVWFDPDDIQSTLQVLREPASPRQSEERSQHEHRIVGDNSPHPIPGPDLSCMARRQAKMV